MRVLGETPEEIANKVWAIATSGHRHYHRPIRSQPAGAPRGGIGANCLRGISMAKRSKSLVKPYAATPREQEAVDAYLARLNGQKTAPRIKVGGKKGETTLQIDHPDLAIGQVLLMEALGTPHSDFMDGLIRQLVNVATRGREADESGLNFLLAMVKGVEPQDQVEAMLAAQMAAVHNATMTFARRLNHVDNIPQQDSAERAFNKLARTFATQVEALKRYRTGGQQRVTVEHVTVNAGGQAVVGALQAPGVGVQPKSEDQPHARQAALQVAYAPGATLQGTIEAEREAVPVAGRPGA